MNSRLHKEAEEFRSVTPCPVIFNELLVATPLVGIVPLSQLVSGI